MDPIKEAPAGVQVPQEQVHTAAWDLLCAIEAVRDARAGEENWNDLNAKDDALRAALDAACEAPSVVRSNNDVDLLLRQVFALCEATEEAPDVEPKNEHQRGFERGRRFEAKQIRRAIGDWFQAEFCGRSFMGEPVLAAAPEAPAQADPLEKLTRIQEELGLYDEAPREREAFEHRMLKFGWRNFTGEVKGSPPCWYYENPDLNARWIGWREARAALASHPTQAKAPSEREKALDALLNKVLNSRVSVEQELFNMAAGKVPPPDANKLRELAVRLGDPERRAALASQPQAEAVRDDLLQDLERHQRSIIEMGDKLTAIVNLIRGEPPEGTSHSTHDAVDLVRSFLMHHDQYVLAAEHESRSLKALASQPQAGDQSVYEKCARVCDALASLYPREDVGFDKGYTMCAKRAADQIRALADQASQPQAVDAEDAARYRWLRNARPEERNRLEHYAADALDAAIDAARRAGGAA